MCRLSGVDGIVRVGYQAANLMEIRETRPRCDVCSPNIETPPCGDIAIAIAAASVPVAQSIVLVIFLGINPDRAVALETDNIFHVASVGSLRQ